MKLYSDEALRAILGVAHQMGERDRLAPIDYVAEENQVLITINIYIFPYHLGVKNEGLYRAELRVW